MVNIEQICFEISSIQGRCKEHIDALHSCATQISSAMQYISVFEGDMSAVSSFLHSANNDISNAVHSANMLQAALNNYTKVVRN